MTYEADRIVTPMANVFMAGLVGDEFTQGHGLQHFLCGYTSTVEMILGCKVSQMPLP